MSKKQVKSRNSSFGTIVALYKVIKKTLRNERRKTMERKLRNMSWTDFEELRKTAKTIIIPSGACEVYGPQNPLGADILVAKKLSESQWNRCSVPGSGTVKITYNIPGNDRDQREHSESSLLRNY